MALGYTLIDYSALTQAVTQLKGIKEELSKKLNEAQAEMQKSVNNRDIYLSREAKTCQQQFDQMYTKWAKKFDGYVQEYIEFFEKASKEYTGTSELIDTQAKNINQFID